MKESKNWLNKRIKLSEVVPLDLPINIKIEPTRACNFKCIYCYHANNRGGGALTTKTFDKFIISYDFKEKLNSISFAGLGEPLLNKETPYMIKNARKIAKETILVTNGSLLNKETIDKLIESGIDTVRISLQGINSSDYRKNAGFNMNYDVFLDNLSYFYKNKQHTEIYVKIPDILLNTDKAFLFTSMFSDKCDELITMSIQPLYADSNVDYTRMQITAGKSVFETENKEKAIMCPQPFYTLYLLPNGDIYPCCAIEKKNICIGNIISSNSLSDIWNGDTFNNFRLCHCTYTYKNIECCKGCQQPNCLNNPYDNIDSEKEFLMKFYSTRR